MREETQVSLYLRGTLTLKELAAKLRRRDVVEQEPSTSPNGAEKSAGASGASEDTASQETILVGGKEYPKWAVEEARYLIKKTGRDDAEKTLVRMLRSVLIVTEKLENAVLADPEEPGHAVSAQVAILPHSIFGSKDGRK